MNWAKEYGVSSIKRSYSLGDFSKKNGDGIKKREIISLATLSDLFWFFINIFIAVWLIFTKITKPKKGVYFLIKHLQ